MLVASLVSCAGVRPQSGSAETPPRLLLWGKIDNKWQAFLIRPDGTERTTVILPHADEYANQWALSPDGKRLAHWDDTHIWIKQSSDWTSKPIVSTDPSADRIEGVVWTPDGSRLAYATSRVFGGPETNDEVLESNVRVVGDDGSNARRIHGEKNSTYTIDPVAVSPSGDLYWFEKEDGEARTHLSVLNLDNGSTRRLVKEDTALSRRGFALSPDFKVLYFSDDSQGPLIAQNLIDDTRRILSGERVDNVFVTQTGDQLYFSNGGSKTFKMSLPVGKPELLLDDPREWSPESLSPDGRYLWFGCICEPDSTGTDTGIAVDTATGKETHRFDPAPDLIAWLRA